MVIGSYNRRTGGSEQVKPVKPGLHQKSELLYREILRSWIYEGGNFLGFTGKKLVPTPLGKIKAYLRN